MPLSPATLVTKLTQIFASQPSSAASVAQKLADAYDQYAALAIAQTTVPCPMVAPGNKSAIVAALTQALVPSSTSRLGSAFAQSLPLYWLPVKFVGPPIAPPSPAPAVSVIVTLPTVSQLATVLLTPVLSAAQAGQALGSALHAVTSAAIVTFNGPPGKLL